MPEITRVGVLGCGQMGSGIAQVAATAGFSTVVRDLEAGLLAKGQGAIRKSLDKLVEKAKLDPAARDGALGAPDVHHRPGRPRRAATSSSRRSPRTSSSRTSSGARSTPALPAGRRSSPPTPRASPSATWRRPPAGPDRFVGLHFFNPVPLMPLVEVVRAVATSPETLERASTFARRLGKEPIAARDRSGFVVNRLLVPYLLDAVRALEAGRGVHRRHRPRHAARLRPPDGPARRCSTSSGLDTAVRIAEIMFEEYRSRASPRRRCSGGW